MPRGAVAAINLPRDGPIASWFICVDILLSGRYRSTVGMLNIHRCTTCVETLLKEDFNEMGNPRESEGGPDCVPVARQEIRRSESGVPVRAAGKRLGSREGTGRDPVRPPWRRAVSLSASWQRSVHTRSHYY